jgi:hypothetical protein
MIRVATSPHRIQLPDAISLMITHLQRIGQDLSRTMDRRLVRAHLGAGPQGPRAGSLLRTRSLDPLVDYRCRGQVDQRTGLRKTGGDFRHEILL